MLPNITINGRLVRDPEFKVTPQGRGVARITIACNDRYKDSSGEWKDGDALFLPTTVWGPMAEAVADTLKKGDPVMATGKLRTHEWEKDGQKRSAVELTATDVARVLDKPKGGSQPEQSDFSAEAPF